MFEANFPLSSLSSPSQCLINSKHGVPAPTNITRGLLTRLEGVGKSVKLVFLTSKVGTPPDPGGTVLGYRTLV